MKSIKFARRAIAIGIAVFPACNLTAFAAEEDGQTPVVPEAATATGGYAPYAAPANVYVPNTDISKASPADAGRKAHTTYLIRNPILGSQPRSLNDLAQPQPAANPQVNPQNTFAEYPASLACIYKMGPAYAGCVPTNNSAYNATGGWGAIGIVDAYDTPTALADLQYFSSFFGLPAPNFIKVIANGNGHCTTPPRNSGWELETVLDIEWAHAMAPSARIILVEACSNSTADLIYAESVATTQVAAYGGGIISNSWGSGEWSTEASSYDAYFRAGWPQPILYIASSGDSGGTIPPTTGVLWPSASPWVIAAGGTTINRDASGNFVSESCWSGSGGGISSGELWTTSFGAGNGPWTAYQVPLFGASAARHTPDIAADADPASGAWVRYNGSWYIVGGTSLAAPLLAGIINNSSNRLGQAPLGGGYYSPMEHHLIYGQLQTYTDYPLNFYDVTTGSNGNAAGRLWDYCTGIGTPRGKRGK